LNIAGLDLFLLDMHYIPVICREEVEKHHEKLGTKYDWITEVKTTAAY
jgi:hypothetical protein